MNAPIYAAIQFKAEKCLDYAKITRNHDLVHAAKLLVDKAKDAYDQELKEQDKADQDFKPFGIIFNSDQTSRSMTNEELDKYKQDTVVDNEISFNQVTELPEGVTPLPMQ